MLELEYSSERAQLLNSKDSSQIECSIWFLHQRAISNCRQYCLGLLVLISFLFLRRMAGPPVGSAMPARLSTINTRLKGGAQARQTRRGNEPRPQKSFLKKKIQQKLFTTKYSLTKRGSFRLWNHRNFRRGKRKGSWLDIKTFNMFCTRFTRMVIYSNGRVRRNRGWNRCRRWRSCRRIRTVRGDRGRVLVILGTSNRNRVISNGISNRIGRRGNKIKDGIERRRRR